MKKIVIYTAMAAEASPIIKNLLLQSKGKLSAPLPMELYQKDHISLVCAGEDSATGVDSIGTNVAVLASLKIIEILRPDIFINVGTAGARIEMGAKIGMVYHVTQTSFHDRRVPLAGFKEFALSKRLIHSKNLLKLPEAALSTGDSLDMTQEDKKNIDNCGASLKDMEGAAVAYVCSLYKIPLTLIKAVTDLIDGEHPTEDEFLKNLSLATQNLGRVTSDYVKKLSV